MGELILLADDESMVRDVMAEILESLGYRVLKAADGLEAMEQFKAHQQEIALALLDVVMPHLGGMELARKIREMEPDLPVIFLTGYDNQSHQFNSTKTIANRKTLTKPANFEVLRHSIRQLLDDRS